MRRACDFAHFWGARNCDFHGFHDSGDRKRDRQLLGHLVPFGGSIDAGIYNLVISRLLQ